MENARSAKRVYIGDYAGRPRKRWIDTVKGKEVGMSSKQGEWCMVGVTGRSL